MKALPGLAGFGVFIQQLTQGDIQRAISNNAWGTAITGLNKLYYVGSSVLYRLTGIATSAPGYGTNAFVGSAPAINISHAFNKWTGFGALLLALGLGGKYLHLPHTGKMKRFGGAIALGGIFGGLFDPPGAAGQAFAPNFVPSPGQNIQSVGAPQASLPGWSSGS